MVRVIYRRASHAAASLPLCFARINSGRDSFFWSSVKLSLVSSSSWLSFVFVTFADLRAGGLSLRHFRVRMTSFSTLIPDFLMLVIFLALGCLENWQPMAIYW